MIRLFLLVPLVLFLSFDPANARRLGGVGGGGISQWGGPAAFFGVLVGLVLLGRVIAHRAAVSAAETGIRDAATRVSRFLELARHAALLWTAAGLYVLGWGDLAGRMLAGVHLLSVDLAGAALVTMPSYLAWIGLYWAQYPAERTLRELAALHYLEDSLPVTSPPTLFQYLDHHLRTGPGLIVLPVLAVMLTRDLMFFVASVFKLAHTEWLDGVIYLGATAVVFVLAPALLVRVLRTRRLPDGDLRSRLEALARRSGVRVTQLLVWHTGHAAGNAMVTGVLPQLRYVLLSDLLLETMPDDHIEAVFAHELGHVVHWHMAWYGTYVISLSLLLGWLTAGVAWAQGFVPIGQWGETLAAVVSLGVILGGFGLVSRRFERQADVYAARAMQAPRDTAGLLAVATALASPGGGAADAGGPGQVDRGTPPALSPEAARNVLAALTTASPLETEVGPRGAALFADALARVAWVNNLPVEAKNFTHGSIRSRMDALSAMARRPGATERFDMGMLGVRGALVLLALGGGATVWVIGIR